MLLNLNLLITKHLFFFYFQILGITFIRRGDGGMEERVPVRKWAKVAKELFLVEKSENFIFF